VCLDHIQDPQNLGSLLRTAECMGVDLVAIPADRAAGVTPAVVRASSGASEHLNVCRVVNLARSMRSMKELGVWFYGMEAIESAKCLIETDFSGGVGLVIGSEGEGLGRLIRETCDHLVRIPMEGKTGSLNAGTAGAMVMYEVRRQKLKAKRGPTAV
jgi:23S rRNA (guanosine2251-2'-O)-methyltransferase